jgi:hypothetical protein
MTVTKFYEASELGFAVGEWPRKWYDTNGVEYGFVFLASDGSYAIYKNRKTIVKVFND